MTKKVLLGLLLVTSACNTSRDPSGSAPPPPATSAAPAAPATPPVPADPTPAPVKRAEEKRIVKFQEGGITVHTFIASEASEAVTSHIVETAKGLVVIDSQMLRNHAKELRAYADGLGKPISHVIISHGHPDHYFGLELFKGLPIYALKATIADMRARSSMHKAAHKAREGDQIVDEVVYPGKVLLPGVQTIDGVKFEFEQVLKGEDNTQLVVRIPQARTLIVQDLAAGDYHSFTGGLMLDAWAAQMARLRAVAAKDGYTHLLPGHGTPGGVEILADTEKYLAKAKEVFAAAKTQEDYVNGMRAAFPTAGGGYIIEVSAILWEQNR